MEKKKELSNILILVFVGLFLMGTALFSTSDTELTASHYIKLDEGWNVEVNGVSCDETAISRLIFPIVNRGDKVILETTLPETAVPNPILVFYHVHSTILVKLDGEEIFRSGQERYEAGKMVGYGFETIDLPWDYGDRELSVELMVSEDLAFSTFVMPKIYDANWYVKDYLREKRIPLIINLFLVVFGICMEVIALILIIRLRSLQWVQLLCVAVFSIGIGCWSLCNHNLMFIFYDSLLWKALTEYIALYLLPISVFAYFYEEAMGVPGKLRRVAYLVIMAVQVLFTLTAYVLQIVNVCHFPYLLQIQHLILVLMAVYLVYMFASDFFHRRFHSMVLFVGAVSLIVFATFDLLRFNITKYLKVTSGSKYIGMLNIGVMVFIIAMLLDLSKSIIRALRAAARGEALEELAYTDGLTGLANKRRCEDAFDELETKEGKKQYAIGVFDLNNLKKVNDQLGHEEGDAFLRAFSEILKEVFTPVGLVGRTGGDEFMVVIDHAEEGMLEQLIGKMNELLRKKNEEHPNWSLSTAYGFSEYREAPEMSAKEHYKTADGRMYECKKAMKQGREIR